MVAFRSSRALLVGHWRRWQALRVYRRFADFTMIPPATFVNNLVLAARVRALEGCVVECGVWRGGMIAGIATLLGRGRRYYLFDSFEGLPPARGIDGTAALRWQQDTASAGYYDNCAASPEFARKAMREAGATNFELVHGWFKETLPRLRLSEPIALLRLDADWYESTIVCLEHLFDQVVSGGLVIIDDYYAWDGCSRAVHEFLSYRSAKERIRSFGDICYLIKAEGTDGDLVTSVPNEDRVRA